MVQGAWGRLWAHLCVNIVCMIVDVCLCACERWMDRWMWAVRLCMGEGLRHSGGDRPHSIWCWERIAWGWEGGVCLASDEAVWGCPGKPGVAGGNEGIPCFIFFLVGLSRTGLVGASRLWQMLV